MLFIANEENKKKICKPNRVYVHTDTFFTFQSSPLEIQKKKGGAKQKRDEFLLSGLMRRL